MTTDAWIKRAIEAYLQPQPPGTLKDISEDFFSEPVEVYKIRCSFANVEDSSGT
jgi:hypothetical protein